MKKPWEETWERDELAFLGELHSQDSRRDLCAAAPEMARLLLAYEWSQSNGGQTPEGGCPSCFASRLNGHESDCALVYVLAKAGIKDLDVQPVTIAVHRLPGRLDELRQKAARILQLERELEHYKSGSGRQNSAEELREELIEFLEKW